MGTTGAAGDTFEQILEAAKELFYEKGYENATTREITDRAGITKAAMYYHFENKQEILYTICLQAADELIGNMRRAIAASRGRGGDLRDRLKRILLSYANTYLKNKIFNKILLHDIEYLDEDRKRVILDKEKENVHQLRGFLEGLMERGELRPVNATVMTFSLISTLHWLFFWFREDGPLSLEQVIDEIVDLFLFGSAATRA